MKCLTSGMPLQCAGDSRQSKLSESVLKPSTPSRAFPQTLLPKLSSPNAVCALLHTVPVEHPNNMGMERTAERKNVSLPEVLLQCWINTGKSIEKCCATQLLRCMLCFSYSCVSLHMTATGPRVYDNQWQPTAQHVVSPAGVLVSPHVIGFNLRSGGLRTKHLKQIPRVAEAVEQQTQLDIP